MRKTSNTNGIEQTSTDLQSNGVQKYGFPAVFDFAQMWFTITNKFFTFYKANLLLYVAAFIVEHWTSMTLKDELFKGLQFG